MTDTAPAPAPAEQGLQWAYGAVLEAFHNTRKRLNADSRELDRLRALVDQIPEGTHGTWRKRLGDPSQIVDRERLAAMLLEHGLEMPHKNGNPPLEVDYIGPAGT